MPEPSEAALLSTLAERAGIAADYYDITGTKHVTTDDTKRAILRAMGFAVESQEALARSLKDWDEAPWRRACDPARVVKQGSALAPVSASLALEDGRERSVVLYWTLMNEQGVAIHSGEIGPGLAASEVRFLDGRRHVRVEVSLPQGIDLGYYTLALEADGLVGGPTGSLRLIVVPDHCYVPSWMESGQKLWGLGLQLYSLSSPRNWGCGDFTDLAQVVEWAGKSLGAGLIGLNPLHALRNSAPHHHSPYAPLNRLALNELYINLEKLPEFFASQDAQRQYQSADFQAKLKALREGRRVDYAAIAALKRTMLDLSYRQFLKEHYEGDEPNLTPRTPRAKLLERFIQAEGEPLEWYAIFQTLEEERRMIQSKTAIWPEWPKQFMAPGPPAREYGKRHRKRVRFFQYIQWIASEQLNDVQRVAQQHGMPVGLYNDLALGAERHGAEAWMYQSALALGADCGAPPDALGPEGQNWGLPPMNPIALRASGYELLIRLLRNNLRFGGAIRLDHVMALCRLFWIPHGRPATEGTYVHYPFEDLLGIVALESVRAKAVVIGEDLGTVPDWVRDELSQAKVLSYRVLYFERHGDGSCKAPRDYPSQSLAVVATHDLPTLTGFWSGEDLQVRAGLGSFKDEAARRQAWDERHDHKRRILQALKAESLLPEDMGEDPGSVPSMTPALCRAIHLYLARTDSVLVLANLEDGLEELAQTNMPGTVDSHPNWTRKYTVTVDGFLSDERLRDLGACLRSSRPLR